MLKLFITNQFKSDFKKILIDIKRTTELFLNKLRKNPFNSDFKNKEIKRF